MEMLLDGGSRKLSVKPDKSCVTPVVQLKLDRLDKVAGDIAETVAVNMDKAEALAVATAITTLAKGLK